MVFDSILTGRQSSKKLIKEIMQFVNQNIEILGRGLYSPSLKDVAYLEDTQLIFLIFHTFVCKIWLDRWTSRKKYFQITVWKTRKINRASSSQAISFKLREYNFVPNILMSSQTL